MTAAQRVQPGDDRCWQRIGVEGDRSCPELSAYVHCSHCPVYARAASALLDRPLSDEQRSLWTRHYAQQARGAELTVTTLFVFRLGVEWLALPMKDVVEVLERRNVHSLPHRESPNLLGIVNVAGELVPCLSLHRTLQIEEPKSESGALARRPARMLVLARHERRFVTRVDEVHGRHEVPLRDLAPAPATVAQARSAFSEQVFSWEGQSVGLLDAERVFAALERSLS